MTAATEITIGQARALAEDVKDGAESHGDLLEWESYPWSSFSKGTGWPS